MGVDPTTTAGTGETTVLDHHSRSASGSGPHGNRVLRQFSRDLVSVDEADEDLKNNSVDMTNLNVITQEETRQFHMPRSSSETIGFYDINICIGNEKPQTSKSTGSLHNDKDLPSFSWSEEQGRKPRRYNSSMAILSPTKSLGDKGCQPVFV